ELIDDLELSIKFIDERIRNGTIRYFLPIRNKFELLKGSILFDEKLENNTFFQKIWLPSGDFSIRASYKSSTDYEIKKKLLNSFLGKIHSFAEKMNIFSTDDDNITLDLVCIDMNEKGIQLALNNKI
ncbi:MAG: hypothetical protein ACFFD4_03260, partial [Candidatus Odinarchaeota archaeon]